VRAVRSASSTERSGNRWKNASLLGHKAHGITSRYVHSANTVSLAAADAVANATMKLMASLRRDPSCWIEAEMDQPCGTNSPLYRCFRDTRIEVRLDQESLTRSPNSVIPTIHRGDCLPTHHPFGQTKTQYDRSHLRPELHPGRCIAAQTCIVAQNGKHARLTSLTLAADTFSSRAVSRTSRPSFSAARMRPILNGVVRGRPRHLPDDVRDPGRPLLDL
jgi:hypothetical protein